MTDRDPESGSPKIEPLTPAEKEALLARARAQSRELTEDEQAAVFGPPPDAEQAPPAPEVAEMTPAPLDADQLAQLQRDFFPELGPSERPPSLSLVGGVIFDFDDTLAYLAKPRQALLEEGARAAEAFMRSRGMELPADFWRNIVEARRFAEEKSEEEREEHIADDAMSFLLQFFGYPASKLDPAILQQAVDIFYAPEMTAWRLLPQALDTLVGLRGANFKLAIIANYNCDRVFQRTVDFLGLRDYLDICLSSASVEYRKPDAPSSTSYATSGTAALRAGRRRRQPAPRHRRRHRPGRARHPDDIRRRSAGGVRQPAGGGDGRGQSAVTGLAEIPALIKEWAAP